MAFLDQAYDVNELPKGNGNFEPLPPGWYNVTISGAEIKKTKLGNGEYIAVRYDVTGPTHQGRVIFGNLNIKNANPKAEEIGRQQLGDMMRAIGLARLSDTDQLIGGQLAIKLAIRKSEDHGDSNDVKGFKSVEGSVPPAMKSMPASASAPPTKAAPPWAKK
jgi:hypothetical protein